MGEFEQKILYTRETLSGIRISPVTDMSCPFSTIGGDDRIKKRVNYLSL